jgi:GNAT superfamily N-acetyltransferase
MPLHEPVASGLSNRCDLGTTPPLSARVGQAHCPHLRSLVTEYPAAAGMTEQFHIRRGTSDPATAEGLADLLIDVVEGGASVGFMWPLSRDKALEYARGVLAGVERGERILLVAQERESGVIVGTVQVVLAMPDNQPHRADVAKMQVHRRARRRGLGAALMRAAEGVAIEAGKSLLVLDTVTGSDADRLYAWLGWERVGEIPEYALLPRGGLCSTTYFYRRLK